MKIVLAFLATVFITAFQAYEGARKVSVSDQLFFQVNKATKKQSFWMLSFPSSLDWVIQSLKLNSGFCILALLRVDLQHLYIGSPCQIFVYSEPCCPMGSVYEYFMHYFPVSFIIQTCQIRTLERKSFVLSICG